MGDMIQPSTVLWGIIWAGVATVRAFALNWHFSQLSIEVALLNARVNSLQFIFDLGCFLALYAVADAHCVCHQICSTPDELSCLIRSIS